MNKNLAILLIIIGVFAWGSIHALGAYLFNHNPWRAVMVAGCVDAFLLFWLVLLAVQRRKLRHRRGDKEAEQDFR